MPNDLSTGTAFAGAYGAWALAAGSPLLPMQNEGVTVYETDGVTLATIYTDRTRATIIAGSEVVTDLNGTFGFYADPGLYVLGINLAGSVYHIPVSIAPDYADCVWNEVIDTAAGVVFDPVPGDSRLCNATTDAATYDLPSPIFAARIRVAKTDVSASGVSMTTPTGAIVGPYGLNVTTLELTQQGQVAELVADGTNYRLIGGVGDPSPYVGLFGPQYLAAGSPLSALTGASVSIFESDGVTLATIYTDYTAATAAGNPTITDANGAFSFYAKPGKYVYSYSIAGTPNPYVVVVQPWRGLTG